MQPERGAAATVGHATADQWAAGSAHGTFAPVGVGQVTVLPQVDGVAARDFCWETNGDEDVRESNTSWNKQRLALALASKTNI